MVGKTISHYSILEKIGQGGMGMVFKAKDTKLDRIVAMKFLPPNIGTDEDQKQRFLNEAKTASALDHPNIGSIYEIDETADGNLFIVMAYYEGETLREKIRQGPVSLHDVLKYAIEIAEGMTKAHGGGVIHRDLKPANILVTNDGIAKIIDFGLAKLKGGEQLTRTGMSLGTAAYMSPEQAMGEDVDGRSDVWSLGIMMYEMLAGKLPFVAEFEAAMLYLIVNENPKPIYALRTDVPVRLEEIIGKAMHKDREQRHQRMEDLLQDLTSLRKDIEYGLQVSKKRPLIAIALPKILEKPLARVIVGGSLIVLALAIFVLIKYVIKPRHLDRHPTIAVLPFTNKGNPELDYLSDGITKDIITQVSKIPNVVTVSRTTSFLYKNTDLPNHILADKLGIRYLLNGSFQQAGSRVTLNCFLYDSSDHQEIWDRSFDKDWSELFNLRNEIIPALAEELGMTSLGAKSSSLKTTPKVYDLFLRGLYHFHKYKDSDNAIAIQYFLEALTHDSLYVPAIVSLARGELTSYSFGWNQKEATLTIAERYCRKALQHDTSNAQAYVLLSDIYNFRGDDAKQMRYLQQAVALDSANPQALTNLARMYLFSLNIPAKGILYLKKLQEIDPTDWQTNSDVGVGYAQLKDYTEAERWFRLSIKFNPENADSWSNLGYTYERLALFDSAAECYNISLQKDPKNPLIYENLTSLLLANGEYPRSEAVLLRGIQLLSSSHELRYELGVTYKLMGKHSNALQTFSDGLRLIENKIQKNKSFGSHYADESLFLARLNQRDKAIGAANRAFQLDSSNNDVVIKVARMYAILGKKDKVIEWYRRAKAMNPEYDEAYLSTALDFEGYRKDPDLLIVARGD